MLQFFTLRVLITATSLLVLVSVAGVQSSNGAVEEVPDTTVAVDIMPEMIYQVAPEYPTDAEEKGIEGDVWIKALIDKQGNTVKAIVYESSGTASLDKSALAAAQKFRYKPALQDDKPVAVWVKFKVKFTLDEKCDK